MRNFIWIWICGFTIGLFSFVSSSNAAENVADLKTDLDALSSRVAQLENTEKPATDTASEKKKTKDMMTYWKEGVRFKYKKDGIEIKFGGRIQNDWLFWTGNGDAKQAYGEFDPNGSGPHLKDGVEFRRARIYISGLLYNHVKFKAQYDFAADGVSEFKDVYVGLTKVPFLGELLVGHFKEPFSLDELTSSKYLTFLERGTPNVFAPGRNTGIMIANNYKKRVTWALGVFRNTNNSGFDVDDNNYNITGRLTGTPLYSDGGKMLVHLGTAFSYRNPKNDNVRYRQRPEHHLTGRFLDTRDPVTGSDIQSDGVTLVGAEAAMVAGPFSMQGEYMASMVNIQPVFFTNPPANTTPFVPYPWAGSGDALFQGYYVFASYFLTGEHRPYKTTNGTFGRVKPKKVFLDGKGGTGAIEVGFRYSGLDLQDGPFQPNLGLGQGNLGGYTSSFGRMDNYTWVLNWYLNPNARVSTNFTISDPDPNGLAYLSTTRFQVDF